MWHFVRQSYEPFNQVLVGMQLRESPINRAFHSNWNRSDGQDQHLEVQRPKMPSLCVIGGISLKLFLSELTTALLHSQKKSSHEMRLRMTVGVRRESHEVMIREKDQKPCPGRPSGEEGRLFLNWLADEDCNLPTNISSRIIRLFSRRKSPKQARSGSMRVVETFRSSRLGGRARVRNSLLNQRSAYVSKHWSGLENKMRFHHALWPNFRNGPSSASIAFTRPDPGRS